MKKIFLSLSILAALGLASCSKQLDLRPTDTIDNDRAYTSVPDLEQGLLGVYSATDQTNKVYIGSILADEARISSENRGQGQFEFKWQYSSNTGGVTAAYRQSYTVIDRIHRILAAYPKITPANQAETDKMALIQAELSGLKGIAYFESLINVMPPGYDPNALGIAIVNESCLFCTPPRNTVGQVVAEIERLLAEARASALLPSAPTNPTRLSKAAIAAYQARVAMLKKSWAAAVTFASDAITLSGKTLATGQTFFDYWEELNESESILKYKNQVTPSLLWRDSNGDVFFEPSVKLKNLYDRDNDIRFDTYFASSGQDTSIVAKYPGSSAGGAINDLKIIRLSELYLTRAEAYAHNNQIALAAADVNAVRTARIAGYTPVTFASQGEAETAVLNERFKELCFEGFRYYDLKRNSLPINRLAVDVQSNQWLNLPATDYRFTLPIPQNALDANPNTVQNNGY